MPAFAQSTPTATTASTETDAAATAAAAAKKQPAQDAVSCNGTLSSLWNPGVCIARALFAGIAAFLIFIGVWFLTACGLLFETILKYTVVDFASMFNLIKEPVNAAWTAIRDISNILIIGFFTFIAISTILGSQEYGAKKLLARVLIIAVLINFSLLFTKIIIDASNFTALQFYNASLANVDANAAGAATAVTGVSGQAQVPLSVSGASGVQIQSNGIAGNLITYLGVTGFADSYNKIREQQEKNDNAIYGLALGLLAFIFLSAVGLVFLYGSFLLVSRAILFILLLITSSGAFSTYLIPKLSENYGFAQWSKALFSNALLAPVLMMMLWVTLTVGASISSGIGSKGTIGDLAQNATSSGNIAALFSYLLILGLLFASFKLASSFSTGIVGFNFASMLTALPILGALRAAAPILQNTVGARFARKSMDTDDRIDSIKTSMANKNLSSGERLALQKDLLHAFHEKHKYDARAKSTFDALNTRLGQTIAKATSLPAGLTKQTKTNYADSAKAIADHAAKEAASATISKGDARDALEKLNENQKKQLETQRDTASQLVKAAESVAQQQKSAEGIDSEHKTALDRARQIEDEVSRKKVDIENRHASGSITRQQRDAELRQEDAKIKDAHGLVKTLQSRMDVIDKPIQEAKAQLAAAHDQVKALNNQMEEDAKGMVIQSTKNAQDFAAAIVHERKGNFIPRFFGQTVEDNTIAQMARGVAKKKVKAKGIKEKQLAEREILEDAGETAAPAGGDAQH
jgi:hypothetical protein